MDIPTSLFELDKTIQQATIEWLVEYTCGKAYLTPEELDYFFDEVAGSKCLVEIPYVLRDFYHHPFITLYLGLQEPATHRLNHEMCKMIHMPEIPGEAIVGLLKRHLQICTENYNRICF